MKRESGSTLVLLSLFGCVMLAGCNRCRDSSSARPAFAEHAAGQEQEKSSGAGAEKGAAPSAVAPALKPVQSAVKGTRVIGPVVGGFAPLRRAYVPGEPILIEFTVTNRSDDAIHFDVGSDHRNSIPVALRYNVIVKDAQGREVCNLAKYKPAAFGGTGYRKKLNPGERFEKVVALNAACPPLLQPGKYVATLVRSLSDDQVAESSMPPPDYTQQPIAGFVFPTVASDLELTIADYDAAELRARLAFIANLANDRQVDRADAIVSTSSHYWTSYACRIVLDDPSKELCPLPGTSDALKSVVLAAAFPPSWPTLPRGEQGCWLFDVRVAGSSVPRPTAFLNLAISGARLEWVELADISILDATKLTQVVQPLLREDASVLPTTGCRFAKGESVEVTVPPAPSGSERQSLTQRLVDAGAARLVGKRTAP